MSDPRSDLRRNGRIILVGCVVMLAACGGLDPTSSLAVRAPVTASPAATAPSGAPSSAGPSIAGSGPAGTLEASATSAPHLRLVALGDSIARANSCPGCTDFVDLYARAITAATGTPVDVDNRAAVEESGLPPVEVTHLLNDILTDVSLRGAIAAADVVVLSVGFNDTPWNRLDDPCDASNVDGSVIAWAKITPTCISRVTAEYKQTLDELYTQIDELRGCFTPPGQPADFCALIGRRNTLLRLVTVYDDWNTPAAALGPTESADAAFVDAQCRVVREHGGRCADAFHALNGSHGTTDAGPYLADDHTHLNARGHQRIAELLALLGFAPLSP